MILHPEKLLLVKMFLPSPKELKEEEKHRYDSVVALTRRCFSDYTHPCADTGFQLVPRQDESSLLQCCGQSLQGLSTEHKVLRFLTAPGYDEYWSPVYEDATRSLIEAVAEEFDKLHDSFSIQTKRVNRRSFKSAERQVLKTQAFLDDEVFISISSQLSKYAMLDLSLHRAGIAAECGKIATLLRSSW